DFMIDFPTLSGSGACPVCTGRWNQAGSDPTVEDLQCPCGELGIVDMQVEIVQFDRRPQRSAKRLRVRLMGLRIVQWLLRQVPGMNAFSGQEERRRAV